MPTGRHSVDMVAATVGFIALILLWSSVVWGTLLRVGWRFSNVRHQTLYGVHQTLSLVGLTLGVVHALAQLAVPGGPVHLLDEVLPFSNGSDPFGTGLGVISLELLVALAISVLVQRTLGYHRWRVLHLTAYLAFTVLCAHVLVSGSDTTSTAVQALIVVGWLSTLVLRLATTHQGATLRARMADRAAGRPRERQVPVNVDPSKCARFGFCEHEAPDVFRLSGDGGLSYRPTVRVDQMDQVRQAARVCPARAILVGRAAMTMPTEPADNG